MQPISPYRYPLITSLLTPNYGSDSWDVLTSNDHRIRNRHEAVIERLGARVLGRVLPLLGLKVNNKPVYTWDQIKRVQGDHIKAHEKAKIEDPDDLDYWDLSNLPVEMTLIFQLASSQRPRSVDWGTFFNLYQSLDQNDQKDLDTLLTAMFDVDTRMLMDTNHHLWAVPEKIKDLPPTRNILGREFYEIEPTKWRRIDLAVNEHKILLLQERYERDDEEPGAEEKRVVDHHLVGCAATLEGAIEVASIIESGLVARHELNEYRRCEQVSEQYIAIEILNRRGDVVLKGNLESQQKKSSIPYNSGYDMKWEQPIERANVEQAKERIAYLEDQAREEIRGDNFNTANRLRREAGELERLLPSKKFDSFAAQDTLRKTMVLLGNHKQSGQLFSLDLGL